MPIIAAGIPIYYVGAAAFTSLAAAYAYINREGLSESISDAYDYYTGNDELTTLEDLGIKVEDTSKTYKTYEYAFPSNSSTDKDLTLTQIKDIKSFPNMSQSGYSGTNFVGENQQVIRLDKKIVNSPTIKPQIDELIKLENNKTTMIQKGVFSKLDQQTQSFYEDQIRAKETNIANALKQNTVVLEEKQTRIMPNMSTADYKGNNFIGQNVSQVVPIEKTVINAKNTSADLSTIQAKQYKGDASMAGMGVVNATTVSTNTDADSPPVNATGSGNPYPVGSPPPAGSGNPYPGGYASSTDTKISTTGQSDAVEGAGEEPSYKKRAKTVNEIDNSQTGQNQLYDLEPYTYDFSLSSISLGEYNSGEYDALSDKNVVIRSSGLGKTGNAPGSELNTHIRAMNLASVVGLNSKTMVSNVHNLTFTVFEPFGTNLLTDLHDAAVAAGHPNYLRGIYLLTLRFHGYTDDGKPNTNYGPKKFFPIRIFNCNFNVTGGGTEYEFQAVPYSAVVLEDTTNKITQPVNLKGSTVGELLFELQTQINKQQQIQDGKSDIGYKIRIVGAPGTLDRITNELVKGDKLEILYNPGYNNPQAFIMWGAKINHDKFSQSATKVIEELTEEGKLNIADVEQGKIKFQDKFTERVYHFNRGTSVLSIIQAIIDSSDYILRQTATEKVMGIDVNANGEVPWYKVDYKVLPAEDDSGFHFYNIRPYYVDQFKAFPDTVGGVKYNIKKIAREYNYVYTGQNQDILDFDLQYDFAFFAAVSSLRDNSPGGDDKRIVKGDTITQNYGVAGGQGLQVDKGLVPVQSKSSDVDDRGSTQGSERGDVTGYRTSNIIKEQLSNPTADLINLELTILGDPFYLAQEDFSVETIPADVTNSYTLADNSINMNEGMVYLKVNFKTPVDFDDETGRYDLAEGGKYSTSFFGGIFQLIQIDSSFEEGRFTQRLTMVRLRHQEAENVEASANAGDTSEPADGEMTTGSQTETEKNTESKMNGDKGAKSESNEKVNTLLNADTDKTNGQSNSVFNKIAGAFQAGASGSGRNNPDSANYVGPKTATNVTADNKIIGRS